MNNTPIVEAFFSIASLQDRIDAIKEREIKPLQDLISNEWKQVKAFCEENGLDYKAVKKAFPLFRILVEDREAGEILLSILKTGTSVDRGDE